MNHLEYLLERTQGALFISFDDLAEIFGCPVQTLYNQRSDNTFPFRVFPLGRKVRISVFDLAHFLGTGEFPGSAACDADTTLTPSSEAKRRPGRPPKYKGRSL